MFLLRLENRERNIYENFRTGSFRLSLMTHFHIHDLLGQHCQQKACLWHFLTAVGFIGSKVTGNRCGWKTALLEKGMFPVVAACTHEQTALRAQRTQQCAVILFHLLNRVVGLGKVSQRGVIWGPILISKRVESKWGDGLKQWSPDISTDHWTLPSGFMTKSFGSGVWEILFLFSG